MNVFWKTEPEIQTDLIQVQTLIQESVEKSHGFIRQVLISHVGSGGKMLRPALVLISAQAGLPQEYGCAIHVASILEMVHLASLIHDDILDAARTRRGLPTLYAQLGVKQAVLAGDYLLSKAISLINGKEGDLEPTVVSHAFGRLCESELEQDATQGDFFISRRTYLRRIAGKTASLFALCCYAGAAAAKAPKEEQKRLARIGYAFGMAFQIQDDVLDYTGSEAKLGKATGKDLRCGIPTLPLLLALETEQMAANTEQSLRTLLETHRKLTGRTLERALERVVSLGGVEQAQAMAALYTSRAMRDIAGLKNTIVADRLTRLFEKMNNRSV